MKVPSNVTALNSTQQQQFQNSQQIDYRRQNQAANEMNNVQNDRVSISNTARTSADAIQNQTASVTQQSQTSQSEQARQQNNPNQANTVRQQDNRQGDLQYSNQNADNNAKVAITAYNPNNTNNQLQNQTRLQIDKIA